jgi:hypothetical protein
MPAGLTRSTSVAVLAILLSSLLSPLAVAPPADASPARPAAAAADRASDTGDTPLAVSMSSISPSTVPSRGKLTVSGEITNRSDSTWTDLRVYLLMSSTPMTTSDEVAEANASAPESEVGARITTPGLYQQVPDLKPGESTFYSLSVPRKALPVTDPGVYWLGVHVLGTNEEGRLDGADGRARTFITSMPARGPKATLSVVVPLRASVRRTADGQVAAVPRWSRRLATDGRLGRLLDFTETASDVPVTWLADPAVLDAVRSLSEGNPAFDLSPTDSGGDTESSAPPSATPGPVDEGSAGDGESDNLEELAADTELAQQWLSDFSASAATQAVLALPYGDVDAATMFRGDFEAAYSRADELGGTFMDEIGVNASPVVAPQNGLFPNVGLGNLDPGRTLLLSERAASTDASKIRLRQGTQALLSSDVASIGGPAPTSPHAALALRQRILAEAAVHGLTGQKGQPLVVQLPNTWDPGDRWRSSAFFEGLSVPWLSTVDLPFAVATSSAENYDDRLRYSAAARRRELPEGNVEASEDLDSAGSVLAELLSRNDSIDNQMGRAAMLGSSTNARRKPLRAEAMTRRITASVRRVLDGVYVEGSPLVTMSSESGNFQVTVVNTLDQAVQVGIDIKTGSEALKIKAPEMVSLGPGQRASVRLSVTSAGTGVHSVLVSPTTEDGRPLGRSTTIKVRSSQVGFVIWIIMATGGVVFVAALGTRIRRRFRSRRQADQPEVEDVPT